MGYSLDIELPGLPRMVNDLGSAHWAVKHKHNRYWNMAVHAQVIMDYHLPVKPLTKALVTLTRYSSVEPDFDNLVNSHKVILDSLIKCGVLEDDCSDVIGQPTYVWEKCSPGEGRIKIEVVSEEGF